MKNTTLFLLLFLCSMNSFAGEGTYTSIVAVTDDYNDNSKDNNVDSIVAMWNEMTIMGKGKTWDLRTQYQQKNINTYETTKNFNGAETGTYNLNDTNLYSQVSTTYGCSGFIEVVTVEAVGFGKVILYDGSMVDSVVVVKTSKTSSFPGGNHCIGDIFRPDTYTYEWHHAKTGVPVMRLHWQPYYNGIEKWMNFSVLRSRSLGPIIGDENVIEFCDSYIHKGVTYNSDTIINDTLKSVNNFDSVAVLKLVKAPVKKTVDVNFCYAPFNYKGVEYQGSSNTITVIDTVKGLCDSIITRNLVYSPTKTYSTIDTCISSVTWKGIKYSTNVYLYDTLKSVDGCDSIHRTYWEFNPIKTYEAVNSCLASVTWKGTIYSSNSYLYDTLKTSQGCDSIHMAFWTFSPKKAYPKLNACETFTFKGQTYTSSVSLRDTLKTTGGCDSINYISVTVASDTALKPEFAHIEDFESQNSSGFMCIASSPLDGNWKNANDEGSGDWSVMSKYSHGYTADHTTGSGKFIQTDYCFGDTAANLLFNYCGIDMTNYYSASISFWYQMQDSKLRLVAQNEAGITTTLLELSADQKDSWRLHSVDLSAYAGEIVRFWFEGIRNPSTAGNVSLDDIEIKGSKLVTGINQNTNLTFSVFPNPSKSLIKIKTKASEVAVLINIVSMDGKTIYSNRGSISEIDVSSFSAGVYTVEVEFENGVRKSKRFVKN